MSWTWVSAVNDARNHAMIQHRGEYGLLCILRKIPQATIWRRGFKRVSSLEARWVWHDDSQSKLNIIFHSFPHSFSRAMIKAGGSESIGKKSPESSCVLQIKPIQWIDVASNRKGNQGTLQVVYWAREDGEVQSGERKSFNVWNPSSTDEIPSFPLKSWPSSRLVDFSVVKQC